MVKKYEQALAFVIVLVVVPILIGILGTLIAETW